MLSSTKLRKSREFRAVYEKGKRLDGRFMTVFVIPNYSESHRLGITASRKVSLRAVDRNRLKRLVRESFRLSGLALSRIERRYDWVINVKRSLLAANIADSLADFQSLIARLESERKLKPQQNGQEQS